MTHCAKDLRKTTSKISPTRLVGVATLSIVLSGVPAFGLEPSSGFDAADDTPGQPVDGTEGEKDDLDQLLDMADQDVGQLSNVKVATSDMGSGSAPAFNVEVSTVSRQKSTVGRSPTAVFVISNDMIRRSGARTIPDVLRMVPGVQVARIDANKWAVTIRGYNGRFANKLLVQIDGRSVYTPLFGGVFWDVQDVLLEDIERVEVIRGPGATVWGANAVNGVINIITKSAGETQGAFAETGGGTEERGFASVRYGGRAGNRSHYRVYAKWFERDEAFLPGSNATDDWRMARSGGRFDWEPSHRDRVTFQGDVYKGLTGRRNVFPDRAPPFFSVVDYDAQAVGGNALFRWTRLIDDETDWALQAYYDRTERFYQQVGFREDRDTIDVDFQYRFPLNRRNSIICGAAYRNSRDRIREVPFVFAAVPNRRADDIFSYFVQDLATLREDRLYLTAGSKFQHDDYTGFEFQPTVRLLWTPGDRHALWSSVSRAVRSPTRGENDLRITMLQDPAMPGIFPRFGGRRATAEDLLAYEIGMRGQPATFFSWDLATFFHDYGNVVNPVVGIPFVDPGAPPALILPVSPANGVDGQSYGFELAVNCQMTEAWKLYGTYSFLRVLGDSAFGTTSPRNQIYMQSSWDLGHDWEFDTIWRYVDRLEDGSAAHYNALDLRLAWHAMPSLEFSVVGRNMLDSAHPEFGFDAFTGNVTTEVQREVYGMATYRY